MNPIVRLISIVALSLVATACNKSDAPKPALEEKPASAATAADAPAAAVAVAAAPTPTSGSALKIGYSDWPGWVAWEIAIQKGWFKEAGVDVDFKWFEYVPSMEAFSAGKIDAVCMTNGDALVTGATGGKSVGILVNDYSNGNDMIVAKPGITSVAQLKGKTIGVEVGFVDHLLLLHALKAAKLTEKDVKLKNVKTDETPQALKSGDVDAIGAWQPNSGAALKDVPGSKPIFTSADVPGLIYDVLAVSPKSLAERRADWVKVVKVWGRVADLGGRCRSSTGFARRSNLRLARLGCFASSIKSAFTRWLRMSYSRCGRRFPTERSTCGSRKVLFGCANTKASWNRISQALLASRPTSKPPSKPNGSAGWRPAS